MKHDIDMKLILQPPTNNIRTPIVNVLLTIIDIDQPFVYMLI